MIHLITDGNGMPMSACTTPANGDERQQVLPLLDRIKIRTAPVGRPKKRFKVIAADKGYDARWLREKLRKRGIRGQIAKRQRRGNKPLGRPIQMSVPRFQQERCFAWLQRKYRRLVVRWERLPSCFDAFLHLSIIHIWLNKLILVG
ncbi:MAG: transposase [Aphanocapsa sp. GSE-SYN-MK-11-07L]|nr:transposase [Aphanocapsa sp. GSE-SYN-MK-11-07L]